MPRLVSRTQRSAACSTGPAERRLDERADRVVAERPELEPAGARVLPQRRDRVRARTRRRGRWRARTRRRRPRGGGRARPRPGRAAGRRRVRARAGARRRARAAPRCCGASARACRPSARRRGSAPRRRRAGRRRRCASPAPRRPARRRPPPARTPRARGRDLPIPASAITTTPLTSASARAAAIASNSASRPISGQAADAAGTRSCTAGVYAGSRSRICNAARRGPDRAAARDRRLRALGRGQDAAGGRPGVRAMIPDVRMAGPAFTVVAEDDHLPVMSALAEAAPGDVLVIATDGGARRGVRRAVRDRGAPARAGRDRHRRLLPRPARAARDRAAGVRARHDAALGHDRVARARPARRSTAAACDVAPGDIVFGDDDGVLIAPPERIAAALRDRRGDRPRRARDPRRAGARRGAARPDEPRRARRARSTAARRARWRSGSMPDFSARVRAPDAPARRRRADHDPRRQPAGRALDDRRLPEPGDVPDRRARRDRRAARARRRRASRCSTRRATGIPSVREYLIERQEQLAGPAARRSRS